MHILLKIKKEYYILLLILLIALFLRIYRLPEMVGFDFDQEYAVMFAQNVLEVYPIQMIGQGLSVQGLFMGPLYFYYLVPFFMATNLYPIGGYIGSIILGIIIIAAYFFVLRNVFGTSVGITAALLRAILFRRITYDWSMAPSFSSELAALLTWFCMYKYWHGNYLYLLPLGFLFGLYTSFHPILFPFYIVFLLMVIIKYFYKRERPKLFLYLFFSFLFFLIPITPLLLFEYFRNFLELKLLFSLQKTDSTEIKTLKTFFDYIILVYNYPTTLLGIQLPTILKNIFNFIAFLTLMWMATRRFGFWNDFYHRIIFLLVIVIFLSYYFLLPVRVPDYYLLGIEIVFFIYICATIYLLFQRRKLKIVISIILLYVMLSNFNLLYRNWTRQNSISLADKDRVVREIARRQPDNKMSLYFDYDFGLQYGLGYLLRYYNIDAKGGENVPTYTIVIPSSRTKKKPIFSSGDVALILESKK